MRRRRRDGRIHRHAETEADRHSGRDSRFAKRGYPMKKVYPDAAAALKGLLRENMTIAAGGFGLCGIPENFIHALRDSGTKGLTIVGNNAGVDDFGMGLLLKTRQVKKVIASYGGENKEFERQALAGELDRDQIHATGIYVDRSIQGARYEKRIEFRTLAGATGKKDSPIRELMAKRAAQELHDGYYVNLGIGIPTLVANYIPQGINVTLQSENGLLGIGPFPDESRVDPDPINAGKPTVTTIPGSSFFSSADSFAMIRGVHVDLSMLCGVEVAANDCCAHSTLPR